MNSDPLKLDLADRIEIGRFVGRELLLWLWLESELFEATLATKEHGSFGLWVEGRLVLSEGRESTTIKGSAPGHHREAKESLLRGKTPERAGLHLSFGDHECTLVLRGDTLGFAGLVPPAKKKEEEPNPLLEEPKRRPRKKQEEADPTEHDAFYDRMHFAKDVEGLITALYRDFLAVRLGGRWDSHFVPVLERWVRGEDIDLDAYNRVRSKSIKGGRG